MNKGQIVSKGRIYGSVFILCFFSAICMAACGTKKGTGIVEPERVVTEIVTESQEGAVEEPELEKILIDYPFSNVQKGYTLALITSKEQEGQYELQVCNESGAVVQQFSCGAFVEPITFRYEDLQYDTCPDLEIFSADRQSGTLIPFNFESITDVTISKIFLEEAIAIPYYDEAEGNNMLVRTEDDDSVEKIIYQLNVDTKRVDEVRHWRVQKDTKMLTIWDCPEQKMLFEGQTELDETGEPLNTEYFNFLLWNDIYYLSGSSDDDSENGEILVWISGDRVTYEDGRSLLEDFGVEGQNPTYQCYDYLGNLRLELYVNELTGTAFGIGHEYFFTSEMKKGEYLYVFSVDSIPEESWEEPDPFSMKAVDGSDGANQVENYEEISEYREDGQPDFFQSKGNITWLKDGKAEGKDTLVQIDYIYRDDDTLYYRGYQHNSYVFSSTLCIRNSFYDEEGRILYEEGYITHGGLYYYYFYENEGRKPKYRLVIDAGGGYYIPDMIRYR